MRRQPCPEPRTYTRAPPPPLTWCDAFAALGHHYVDAARAHVVAVELHRPGREARGHCLHTHLVCPPLPAPRHRPPQSRARRRRPAVRLLVPGSGSEVRRGGVGKEGGKLQCDAVQLRGLILLCPASDSKAGGGCRGCSARRRSWTVSTAQPKPNAGFITTIAALHHSAHVGNPAHGVQGRAQHAGRTAESPSEVLTGGAAAPS